MFLFYYTRTTEDIIKKFKDSLQAKIRTEEKYKMLKENRRRWMKSWKCWQGDTFFAFSGGC